MCICHGRYQHQLARHEGGGITNNAQKGEGNVLQYVNEKRNYYLHMIWNVVVYELRDHTTDLNCRTN